MKTAHMPLILRQTVLVLSLVAAFAPVYADDEEDAVEALKTPDSSITAGVGGVSGNSRERSLFGQYNGQRSGDAKLILDIDLKRRDDDAGIWTLVRASNLGLDNREVQASYLKQGDWRLSTGYNAITRDDPRTLNTSASNAPSTTPRIVALTSVGSGVDFNLGTKREGLSAGVGKWITPHLLMEIDFKNETKEGARLAGRGIACGAYSHDYNVCGAAAGTGALLAGTTGAYLLSPEPISSTIRQIDAKLSYANEGLKVHGGYYGSFYNNAYSSQSIGIGSNLLNPDGSVLNTATAPGNALVTLMQRGSALAPSNEAHQFYVGGNYAVSPTTRTTFKYAYTHATQNADFVGGTLAGSPTSLGADLSTTLAQVGVTSRVTPQVTLLGNVRYEDRDDKTAAAPAYIAGGKTYTNSPSWSSKLNAKAEASVQLPDNYRATIGVDYASVHRNRPARTALVDGLSGLREDTRETGYRAELRRTMSETLNASLSASHSERTGFNWLSLGAGFPVVSESAIYSINGVFPTTLEDRQRDKIRLSADWNPLDNLSLQMVFEDGKDRFTAPTEQGLRDTNMRSMGLDVVWTVSDNWKVTGLWNQGSQTLHLNNVGYLAELANSNDSISLGVVGTPSSKLQLGATVAYMNDRNRYLPTTTTGGAPLGGGMSDMSYRVSSLKLFGKYALEKNADVRMDLMHQSANLGEWTWANNGTAFAYSDNSTVSLQPNQDVTFLGVTYIYKLK